MQIFYDKDTDPNIIKGKTVAIIGYGSQGHAHANNLRETGVHVVVGLKEGSSSIAKARAAGLECLSVEQAVKNAEVVMLLAPDEKQPQLYQETLEKSLQNGAFLGFAHGFNIHYGLIRPSSNLNVFMVAPKGPGHLVRSTYLNGQGVPTLVCVHQDPSGCSEQVAMSYAGAIGGGRAGIIKTTFVEETETDLFGEQAVLCGGATELIKAGFDTLVEAGYAPEMAYFECLHELKLIVDLIYEGGISNMFYSISNTAEYGAITRGNKIINSKSRKAMKKILRQIKNGKFAREYVLENRADGPVFWAQRRALRNHPVEKVGSKLRAMMQWISENKLVDEK